VNIGLGEGLATPKKFHGRTSTSCLWAPSTDAINGFTEETNTATTGENNTVTINPNRIVFSFSHKFSADEKHKQEDPNDIMSSLSFILASHTAF
jgi:hypothetical protein